jgi:hypothetical protein
MAVQTRGNPNGLSMAFDVPENRTAAWFAAPHLSSLPKIMNRFQGGRRR